MSFTLLFDPLPLVIGKLAQGCFGMYFPIMKRSTSLGLSRMRALWQGAVAVDRLLDRTGSHNLARSDFAMLPIYDHSFIGIPLSWEAKSVAVIPRSDVHIHQD